MKLFFRKYGQGKPIIILHGLFGMSDNWVTIARRLSDRYEVYLPDLRNHGQSPHDEELNYDVMAADLFDFIKQNNIMFPDIIGHSMGGKVVMNFAIKHSNMLDKLIVVDIHPTVYTEHYEHMDLINAMQSIDLSAAHSFSDIDKSLSQFSNAGERLQRVPPVSLRVRQFLLKNILRKPDKTFGWKFNLDNIQKNLHLLLGGIASDTQYTKHVLFIKGGLSNYIKEEDYADIRHMFPNSEIKIIPRASHWVHADAPEEFLNIVCDFLE